ncbi:MAG: hypothetical protein ABI863_17430 [Ginsengibacter sp.]
MYGNNKPPVAHAGKNTTIILPVDSVILDGRASTDDKKIVSYQWTKISGPDTFKIVLPTAAQTKVNKLVEGVFEFELKVTDADGLFSKDTVQVTVQPAEQTEVCDASNRATITIQLTPIASMPFRRWDPTAATIGNKLLLAGGGLSIGDPASVSDVSIYDFSTQSWSTAHLSMVRGSMTSATVGNKVFFAGGEVPGFVGTTRVDIYDAFTNTWTSSNLPAPTFFAYIAPVGNKVFFTSERAKVDIYDISTGLWSELNLSQPRTNATSTTVGNKVYFAGGSVDGSIVHLSNVVDIYDNATGTWSTSSLSQPSSFIGSIYVNGKIYWAGGVLGYDPVRDRDIATCKVEIRDVSTQTSSFTNLSRPNEFNYYGKRPIFYKGKIIFPAIIYNPQGATLDIYDPQSNTWFIGKLPPDILVQSLVLVNNALYAVGNDVTSGSEDNYLINQIWKLQY